MILLRLCDVITMSDKNFEYEVLATWSPSDGGRAVFNGKPELHIVNPKGLRSDSDLRRYTPEDLVVAATATCFMNSFVYFTKRMHISFLSFECRAVGTLSQVGRSFEITRIVLRPHVVIEDESIRAKMKRALELGAKYCFVANSLKCEVTHDDEILIADDDR